MRLAVLELPHRFGEVAAQLARIDDMLASHAEPGDVVVLPELALSGYVSPSGDFDLRAFAEPIDGPTSTALRTLGDKHRVALCASFVERDGHNLFNTLTAPSVRYRKRHPWYPETWATPGNLPYPLVELGGVALTFATCFDVHFLRDEAADVLHAADWLVFPSAWVEDAPEQREAILLDLARTFDIGVVNANWGRGVPPLSSQGRSMILDADGVLVQTSRQVAGPQWITYRIAGAHADTT